MKMKKKNVIVFFIVILLIFIQVICIPPDDDNNTVPIEKTWTIMVWLYDFQSRYASEPGMCMASFALASVPTLLVFLFCQKIIMRGIVIPTMK